MITDDQARALAMIDAAGGFANYDTTRKLWFVAGVRPSWSGLIRQGYIRDSGLDTWTLTDKGRDAYSSWYSAKGFGMDRQIETWRDYAVVE